MLVNYEIGDTCYISLGRENGKDVILQGGTVVHKFTMIDSMLPFYVIRLFNEAYSILEVRTTLQMSKYPDGDFVTRTNLDAYSDQYNPGEINE